MLLYSIILFFISLDACAPSFVTDVLAPHKKEANQATLEASVGAETFSVKDKTLLTSYWLLVNSY